MRDLLKAVDKMHEMALMETVRMGVENGRQTFTGTTPTDVVLLLVCSS